MSEHTDPAAGDEPSEPPSSQTGSHPPPPPPPGYGQQGFGQQGYGQQGYGQQGQQWSPPAPYQAANPPMSPADEKMWSVLVHCSFFVFGLLGPLIVLLVMGNRGPFLRHHTVEALNFHITVLLAMIASVILIFAIIGIVLIPIVLIAGVVFTIMAAIAANSGQWYRYPVSLRLVK